MKVLAFSCTGQLEQYPELRKLLGSKEAKDAGFEYIDVELRPEMAASYGVNKLPAFIAFDEGDVLAMSTGFVDIEHSLGWAAFTRASIAVTVKGASGHA